MSVPSRDNKYFNTYKNFFIESLRSQKIKTLFILNDKERYLKNIFDNDCYIKENINKNLEDWQNKIIYLSQKNYLFEENILSNIVLGEDQKDIDGDRLKNCLKISNFINAEKEFPEGLNTQIGGNNFKISGGQQKKIQISRCFYQITTEKKLIILDEPTENLDSESKIIFFKELNKYKNKLEKNMIFKILGDINIFFNIVQNDL